MGVSTVVLPEELMRLASCTQWIVHRSKIPFNPLNGTPAKSNAPETWGTLHDALNALHTGNFDGLGFQFGIFEPNTLRVSGIDLDHVLRSDGTLEPFAEDIVKLLDSYTEYSPSGKGLHILCRTSLNDIGRKRGINDYCAIEMYNHRRYFTVTGDIYGIPKAIEERTAEFKEVYDKYFSEHKQSSTVKSSTVSDLTDLELLDKMFNSRRGTEIRRLYNGDFSGYPSQSEADLALVSDLVFWTQRDLDRVDRLFRSSGLYRSKWERADYRNRTLEVALRSQYNVYEPSTSNTREQSSRILPLSETRGQDVKYYLDNELNSDMENFGNYKDMKTGFSNLDKLTKLYPGLYVLGAISSLGKTTFACQFADQLAKSGKHVLFFSLEQSKFELVTKGLSRLTAQESMNNNALNSSSNLAVSAVSAMQIREGVRTPAVLRAIEEYKNFGEHNVIYQCGFDTNISTILDRVNDYIEDNKVVPVVIIDYLQIIRPLDSRVSTKEAVDENVRALKKLQVEKDLVVLLISSLNRSNYLTPVDFESFKESGGIEYTADVIWGLQLSVMNDEIFDKEKGLKTKRDRVREAKRANPREVELVCLKNRYGISSYVCKFDYYAQYDYFVPRYDSKSMSGVKAPVKY